MMESHYPRRTETEPGGPSFAPAGVRRTLHVCPSPWRRTPHRDLVGGRTNHFSLTRGHGLAVGGDVSVRSCHHSAIGAAERRSGHSCAPGSPPHGLRSRSHPGLPPRPRCFRHPPGSHPPGDGGYCYCEPARPSPSHNRNAAQRTVEAGVGADDLPFAVVLLSPLLLVSVWNSFKSFPVLSS